MEVRHKGSMTLDASGRNGPVVGFRQAGGTSLILGFTLILLACSLGVFHWENTATPVWVSEEGFRMDLEIFPHKLKIILLSTNKAFDTVRSLKSVFPLGICSNTYSSFVVGLLCVFLSESFGCGFCFQTPSKARVSASFLPSSVCLLFLSTAHALVSLVGFFSFLAIMLFYLFFIFIFNWRIRAFQYCVGFCHSSA